MITLAQVDTQIDTAWSALRVNELEYTVQGRTLKFRTLGELQRHVNWLIELKQSLTASSNASADSPLCPVVEYANPE